MRRARNLLVTAAVLLSLPLAGCGGGGSSGGSPAGSAAPAAGADGGAARLRARLTGLLEDRVYLTGQAVAQAVRTPPDPALAQAAADAADASAVVLATAIGRIYGREAGARVLALLREENGFVLQYAKGRAARDENAVQQALADLDAFRGRFGDELNRIEPNLKSGKVSADLRTHFEALVTAINAIVAGTPGATAKLADAAAQMSMTAGILATGIASGKPDRFTGTADSSGAVLRAGLTSLLRADAHLTLRRSAEILATTGPVATPAVRADARTIDANATTLSQSISSVYGEDAGDQILRAWRAQARAFGVYAAAKRSADPGPAATALTGLDRSTATLARLLGNVSPELGRAATARAVSAYVDAVTAAIRAEAAGSPKRFLREADAADASSDVAAALAQGISRQFPDSFTAG